MFSEYFNHYELCVSQIDSSMPIFERPCLSSQKRRTQALPVDTRLMFDVIGTQLNCSAIVDGIIYNWRNLLYDSWYDFQNLTILSFHDSAGVVANNTTMVANATTLHCPRTTGHVRFTHVMCTIDFSGLMTIPSPGLTTLRVGFRSSFPRSPSPCSTVSAPQID